MLQAIDVSFRCQHGTICASAVLTLIQATVSAWVLYLPPGTLPYLTLPYITPPHSACTLPDLTVMYTVLDGASVYLCSC